MRIVNTGIGFPGRHVGGQGTVEPHLDLFGRVGAAAVKKGAGPQAVRVNHSRRVARRRFVAERTDPGRLISRRPGAGGIHGCIAGFGKNRAAVVGQGLAADIQGDGFRQVVVQVNVQNGLARRHLEDRTGHADRPVTGPKGGVLGKAPHGYIGGAARAVGKRQGRGFGPEIDIGHCQGRSCHDAHKSEAEEDPQDSNSYVCVHNGFPFR
jgi:hypothetical protein